MGFGLNEYSIFTVVDLAALFINLRLVIDLKNTDGRVFAGDNPENGTKRKMFLVMCTLALIENSLSVINDIIYITVDIMDRFTNEIFLQRLQFVDYFLAEASSTVLILLWMLFVDFCVYKSPGHIRKRYPPYYILAGIGVLISAFSMIGTSMRVTDPPVWMLVLAIIQTFFILPVIQLIFAVTACIIVCRYQRERRPPLFLRLSVFLVPVVIGCIIGSALHSCFESLGFAIGLLLTWRVQGNRSRYMDQDSGFYNREFLRVMYDHLEKKGYLNGKGVIFFAPGRTDGLVKAVQQLDYDNSELFLLEDGKMLITTGEQKEEAMELIIRFVEACGREADPPFKVSAEIIERLEGESAGAFTERIIEKAESLAGGE